MAKAKLEQAFIARSGDLAPKSQVLGAAELASLWHPPGLTLSGIKNIAWGTRLTGEAPENLPIVTEDEEAKSTSIFLHGPNLKTSPRRLASKKKTGESICMWSEKREPENRP